MGSESWCLCILAGGQGKRMFSETPKVLLPALGRPLLHYLLDRGESLRFSETVVVVPPAQKALVDRECGGLAELVVQDEPRGTAHAFQCALSVISPDTDSILVVYADMPLLEDATLQGLIQSAERSRASVVLMSGVAEKPAGYGRVVRDGAGRPVRVVEEKDCSLEESGLNEINLGIYAFSRERAGEILDSIDSRNAQGEYYLTDCLSVAQSLGHPAEVYRVPWSDEFHNVNTPGDYARVLRVLRERKNHALLSGGVKMLDPDQTCVDWHCEVGVDSWLYPGTIIEGQSVIGPGCMIGPYSRIADSRIGAGCRIEFSVVEQADIADRVQVGPYSHLRPGSRLRDKVRIGNYVEVKETTIGEGTKALHLSYLGDAEIGKEVNVGAGTITCNFDGKKKNLTTIEDRVFIGTNNSLVAPVRIGEGAYTAAGSTITRDVPPGSLGLGRAKQVNKEGWADRKRGLGDET